MLSGLIRKRSLTNGKRASQATVKTEHTTAPSAWTVNHNHSDFPNNQTNKLRVQNQVDDPDFTYNSSSKCPTNNPVCMQSSPNNAFSDFDERTSRLKHFPTELALLFSKNTQNASKSEVLEKVNLLKARLEGLVRNGNDKQEPQGAHFLGNLRRSSFDQGLDLSFDKNDQEGSCLPPPLEFRCSEPGRVDFQTECRFSMEELSNFEGENQNENCQMNLRPESLSTLKDDEALYGMVNLEASAFDREMIFMDSGSLYDYFF